MPKRKKIPSKYIRNGRASFKKFAEDAHDAAISALFAFPGDVHFQGKADKEEVILFIRKHPVSLLPQFLLMIFFLFAPVVFFIGLRVLGMTGGSAFTLGIGGALVFVLLAISIGVDTFMKWFYTVSIVTDRRIVDVDFVNILFHRFSETQLKQVQDVTHTVHGVMGSIFDYGSVFIQTAASKPEFEFLDIPKPRDVQDAVLGVLEMKKKGEL